MSPRRETVGEAVARRAAAARSGAADRTGTQPDQGADQKGRGRRAAPRDVEASAAGSGERKRITGRDPDGRGSATRGSATRDAAGRASGRRDGAGRPGAGRGAAGREGDGQDAPGRSGTDRSGTGRAGADRAGADRAGTGRAGAGRGAGEGRRPRGGGTDGRGRRRDAATPGDRRHRGSAGSAGSAASAAGTVAERAAERGIGPDPAPAPSPVHRRRRRVAVLVGVLVLLAGLGIGVRVLLLDLGLFDVEDVRVTGTVDVPQADVLAAAAVLPGAPLATVDTAGIASRVALLPGVGAVEVGRGWPHTVTVAVTERRAVAVVRTPDGPQPVDATGVVFPAPAAPGLPQLTFGAVSPEDPSTRAALDVIGALPDDVRAQVVTVDVGLGGGTPQVTLGLTGDRQVRWGPDEEAERKASVLVALLTRPGRVYDVTSPDLPTVRT